MIYLVQGHVSYEGNFDIAYLKHDYKIDVEKLKEEYAYPNGFPDSEYEKFVQWLVDIKGFIKMFDDEICIIEIDL